MQMALALLAPQLIALGVVLALMLVVRLTLPVASLCARPFARRQAVRREARRQRLLASGDFGLLVPIAVARTPVRVNDVRTLLREHGIRATTGPHPLGWVVLVFPEDVVKARYDLDAAGV